MEHKEPIEAALEDLAPKKTDKHKAALELLADLKKSIQSFKSTQFQIEATCKDIAKRTDRMEDHLEKVEKKNEKYVTSCVDACQEIRKKVEAWEDNFYHIMHNIKKNQFLYSHYPEDWVKNFTSIKEGIKKENKFMDKSTRCKT